MTSSHVWRARGCQRAQLAQGPEAFSVLAELKIKALPVVYAQTHGLICSRKKQLHASTSAIGNCIDSSAHWGYIVRGWSSWPRDSHIEADSPERSDPQPQHTQNKKSVPAGLSHSPLLLCGEQNRSTKSYLPALQEGTWQQRGSNLLLKYSNFRKKNGSEDGSDAHLTTFAFLPASTQWELGSLMQSLLLTGLQPAQGNSYSRAGERESDSVWSGSCSIVWKVIECCRA